MTECLIIQLLLNFESRKMHILVKQVMTWISNIPLSCHQLLFSLRSTVRHHIIFAASRNLTSFSFKRYLHLTLSLFLSLSLLLTTMFSFTNIILSLQLVVTSQHIKHLERIIFLIDMIKISFPAHFKPFQTEIICTTNLFPLVHNVANYIYFERGSLYRSC